MSRNNTDQPPTDTEPTPEDTFALIGNEIRVEIIRALGNPHAHKNASHVLSFSDLRSQTNTDLDPGQLNYHLQKLVGHFVTKANGGYTLRPEGIHLYSILQAGVFDRREERVAVDAGFDCYYCQAPVKALFSGGRATVECPDCEYRYLTKNFAPPLETFEDKAAAFEQFSKYIHHKVLGYAHGICQICGNRMGIELVSPEEVPGSGVERSKVYVSRSCDHCGKRFYLFLGAALLTDRVLRSFCSDHGVDVLSTPYWELEFAATDKHLTVHSTDPWEVVLHITYDDKTLELIVDDSLNVVKRNRPYPSKDVSTSLLSIVKSDIHLMGSRESGEGTVLSDNKACLQSLRRHRWPDEVTCPHCHSMDTTKEGTTSKDAQRYRCHTCHSSFNDLTETIFAEHRLSLPEMFYIIREMEKTETAQIARQIDRSYKSVLNFVHEVQDSRDEKA